MKIKNLEKVAKRIQKAIKTKERIIIYGDADLDGVTSVIILKETINNLGGEVACVYFPDRETEGYGISKEGLNFLKNYSPALLIAVDCGIGNFKEVDLAKKLGFKVILIEHHEVLDKLPKADIIVDPKQPGDQYLFKGLASAGITFKLTELLLKDKMTEVMRINFLELVALATLADMMPKQSENKFFIEEGLASFKKSLRPGIQAFFETEIFKSSFEFSKKISKMISILNIRDVRDRLPASFRLLTAPSSKEAKEIINLLMEKSKARKEKIEEIVKTVEERIAKKPEPIIFEGDPSFDLVLNSSAASIICQRYKKPTFLFKKMEKESQGTVRTPSGIDSVALMKKCKKYPLTFGGHPQASGFRMKNEDLEKFKECLIEHSQ